MECKHLPNTRTCPRLRWAGDGALYVGDEPVVRKAIRMVRGLEGHSVEEAHNGPAALKKFKMDEFDLVLPI